MPELRLDQLPGDEASRAYGLSVEVQTKTGKSKDLGEAEHGLCLCPSSRGLDKQGLQIRLRSNLERASAKSVPKMNSATGD